MDYKISVLKIVHDTIVDGSGFRTSVYCAGCVHKCADCHNPESWDINNGETKLIQEIYDEIISNPLTNVTFTGGDPMFQAKSFFELAKLIKASTNKTIWCYTGYLFEDIVEIGGDKFNLLTHVDVLVDGMYVDNLKNVSLKFKGSSNQRIIDVKKSFAENSIVEINI